MLVNTHDPAIRKNFARHAHERKQAMKAFFQLNGIDLIPITTEADYIDPLVRFFRQREKMYH